MTSTLLDCCAECFTPLSAESQFHQCDQAPDRKVCEKCFQDCTSWTCIRETCILCRLGCQCGEVGCKHCILKCQNCPNLICKLNRCTLICENCERRGCCFCITPCNAGCQRYLCSNCFNPLGICPECQK